MAEHKTTRRRSAAGSKRRQNKIAQGKRTRHALVESEELFRSTFENAAVGIAHVTTDGRWLRVNDKLCQILGYTREELSSKTFQEITHPDDVESNLQLLQRALAGEIQTYSMEKRYFRRDGSIMWSNLTVSLIRHRRSGRPLYFISVIEDITARKQAEAQLRESEARLRLVVEGAGMGTWDVDVKSDQADWNEHHYRLLGYRPNQFTPTWQMWRDRIHPEDIDYVLAARSKALANRGFYCPEHRIIRADDGAVRWVAPFARFIYDDEGRAVRFVGVDFDITERKRAEEALRHSEERYRTLVETGTSVILGLTPDHRVFEWNHAAEQIFGWSQAEALGKDYLTTFLTDEVRDSVAADIRQVLAGHATEAYENDVVHRDGSRRTLIWNVCRLLDGQGAAVGILAVGQDISARKQAEESLRRLTEELERRIAEGTTELIYTQAQLRALAGRLQVLQEEERAQLARELHDEFGAAFTALKVDLHWIMSQLPEQNDALKEKARRMSDLIDQSVDSVRRTAGMLRPRLLDDFGLVAAIEWQIEEFERRTGLQCATHLPEEIDIDRSIAMAVFRILQEALTNVARHAQASEVRVALHLNKRKICIEVKDNGKGIDLDAEAKNRSLGLFGMQERAYAFGGHVKIDSQPKRGTRVSVEIPLEKIA
jgi:PAS domain S-box-containing protein